MTRSQSLALTAILLLVCHFEADARAMKAVRTSRLLIETPSTERSRSSSDSAPSPSFEEPMVMKAEGPNNMKGTSASDRAAAWLKSSSIFKGDGTAFSDSVNNTGSGFACSFRFLNNKFSNYFAAINQEQWANGATCGRCVKARCVDDRCTSKKEVLVQIVDLCPECKAGDVDFSFGAYKEVTGLWPHRLSIEWEWASCAPEIEGNIRFDPKDGINQFWQAFYLSNTRYPIKQLKLNGQVLSRSPFNFYIHGGMMPSGESELELTADSGAIITAKLKDLTKQQDLGVQFPLDM